MVDMMHSPEELRPLLAGLTEQTFQVDLGLADPPLIDYLTDLQMRFIRYDSLFRLRDALGRRLEEVAEMMLEADQRQGRPRREVYRHIGDFTLFWTGVYPEALQQMHSPGKKDQLLDYTAQGKRSYMLASSYDDEACQQETPILKRLSFEFELCSVGLNRVRKEWEKPVEKRFSPEAN